MKHVVLLSDDVRFHETLERSLKLISPTCLVSRTQFDGSVATLRALCDNAAHQGTELIIDSRQFRRPELWTTIRKWAQKGGSALLIAETPRQMADLMAHPENHVSLFAHNQHWGADEMAAALSAIFRNEGFSRLWPHEGQLRAGESTLSGSRDRAEFLATVLRALDEIGVQRTQRERVSTVSEEILMNAVYDAPMNAPGSRHFGGASGRRVDLELDEGKTVKARWSLSADEFRLTVTDPYGSLTPSVLTSKIATFLSEEQVEISPDSGGSGVGLYIVLRSVSCFSVFVQPTEFTEMSVRLELAAGPRASKLAKEVFIYFGQSFSKPRIST